MKRVVSVSLGSPRGDKTVTASFLGEKFEISRVGTNGDMRRYAEMLQELDGAVDAIGLGGIDRYLFAGSRRYTIRDADKLARLVRKTPVVDGSGIKNTLERETIEWLQREHIVDFGTKNVLVVCAVDRFGMGEVIGRLAKSVVYGDLMFAVGLPVPIRKWATIKFLGSLLLPIFTRLPFKWVYPTGEKQDQITPKYEKYFRWADVVAGDYKLIGRYLPTPESGALKGKTVITNTLTQTDIEHLRERGAQTVVTSTKEFDGRTFATNVVEGIIVTLVGKRPDEMLPEDYMDMLHKLDWKPTVRRLE
ncbi:MAG: quinate 5-dehydrogenase [Armatimonadetes bacterium]|nr:quinate 5-dehydrogenase [Armatimonadota bacterium]